ncbi:MAG: hypothetical protein AB1611_19440 [bacterium]
MKRWTILLPILSVVLFTSSSGIAQMTVFSGGIGPQTAYSSIPQLFPPVAPFVSSAFYTPAPFLPLPSLPPSLHPSPLAPLPVPLSIPRPMVRNAAATITIIFNPALSVVNVSAVPITAIAPTTTVPTTTLPTTTVPTIAPTAALLLPALLASTVPAGPPYNQTQTLVTPAAPIAAPAAAAANKVTPAATTLTTTTALPSLTALLPFI